MDIQEKTEKLLSDLVRLQFDPQVHAAGIQAAISKGVDKFSTYETNANGVPLDMQLNFSYYEKSDRYVLTDTEALLVKDIVVPPVMKGEISADDLDKAMAAYKSLDLEKTPHETVEQQKEYIDTHLMAMQEHSPDTFNALIAKHDHEFPFDLSNEQLKSIAELKSGQEVYAKFSSYFNLTPDNMRNLLKNPEASVRKQFYAKPKEGEDPTAQRQTYFSWVKPVLHEMSDNGTTKMKMASDYDLHSKLKGMNFVETQDKAQLTEVVRLAQEGFELKLNNLNKTGDPSVRMLANPDMRSFSIYPLNGPRIPKPHNLFRKDPVRVTIGANGVEISRQSENRNSTGGQKDSVQHQNRLAGRERVVNTTPSNGLSR